jgi:oxygen-independent coproporphyrinogen-3 oxidase
MSVERWRRNIEISLELGVPHISSYALTVEPNTALQKFIERGKIKPVDDEAAKLHFEILVETLTKNGFEHYEFSNFGKPGYFSENNTAYWLGKPYLGIGPAAHSYDGNSRKWNISNNPLYIKALENDKIPQETETLSLSDKYNEYVMTRLRTKFGVELAEVSGKFGEKYKAHFLELAKPLQKEDLLREQNGIYHITSKGKFLSDGIAADLFFLD